MEKIKKWIKLLLRYLKRKPREVPPEKKKPRKWWQFPFRVISTRRSGLNMPKQQPCPDCGSWIKRDSKTAGGANYICPKHGLFFARAHITL